MFQHDQDELERQLSQFARSLFGYLYFKHFMYHDRPTYGPHFTEKIGIAVLCIRNAIRDFSSAILENCGYGVNRLTLCQEICNLYPNQDYFKKLYFISAFIFEMMFCLYQRTGVVDLSLAPNLWQAIFRNNFKSEFVTHGGWQTLGEAANHCHEVFLNEILPSENLLPAFIEGVIARVRGLNPAPEQAAVDGAIGFIENENLPVEQMEIDVSVDEVAQSEQKIEENQPEEVAQIEESKEENRPVEVVDRSRPHSSALGVDVAKTKNSGEGTSGKSEGPLPSVGGGILRKRKLDTPPKNDSDTESDSLSSSKAKVEKK